jgi:hypothetical protein
MKTFRKKPVEISAVQVTDPEVLNRELLSVRSQEGQLSVYDYLHDTWVKFELGDWIIRGIKGELYPCKPDVFAATYDEVQ